MKKISLALAVILFSVAQAISAQASSTQTGKIYIHGQWVDAANTSALSLKNQNSTFLFGDQNQTNRDLRSLSVRFLRDNAAALQVDAGSDWAVPSVQTNSGIETHRAAKSWRGLAVLGGEALVHFANGKFLFANADDTSLSQLNPLPRLGPQEARDLAFASYGASAASTDLPKLEVLILENNGAREARLAYAVKVLGRDTVSSDVHYIDAQRGQELRVSPNIVTVAAPRRVLSAMGEPDDLYFQTSGWKTIYANPQQCGRAPSDFSAQAGLFSDWFTRKPTPIGPSADAPAPCQTAEPAIMNSALAAWKNSGLVQSYFETAHQRNSIDDHGMEIRSVVNFGGPEFQNAAWHIEKSVMVYGIGDETTYHDFALPLDVAAHEMTHGITYATAKLELSNESGALSESYSDVFGKLVAFKNGRPANWKLGQELFRNGVGYIRDMENPEVAHTRDFKHRNEPCGRLNDFCGVHINAGIPNRAAVLIAKNIGLEKLGKLYYLTLTQLLRSTSNFRDARVQTETACSTLFGANSSDCRAVSAAFTTVGI